MEEVIHSEWEKITKEGIQQVNDSMPDRITAVIEAKGGHTRC